ncbi:MAG: PQQ-binding-like beta-propeller repeat protein [Myxococcota bacterium]
MPARSSLALAYLALVAAGCHTVSFANDPFAPGGAKSSLLELYDIEWWTSLAPARLWEFAPRELASPAVDPDTHRVIVATRDGMVRALSAVDGTVQWAFSTRGPFNAGPRIHEGIAYLPGADGTLYAIDVRTGGLKWRYDAGEELATTPVVTSGKVLVASQADTLYAVDAKTGQWSWQYRRDTPGGFTVRGAAAPKIDMGVAYIGFSDGYVVALAVADGAEKWERALGRPGGQFIDVDTTPVLDDSGRLYVASYDAGIFALDSQTGQVEWTAAKQGVTSLLPAGDVLFTAGNSQVGAVLAENGRPLWAYDLAGRFAQEPLFARGMLIVPVNEALLFLDPTTGQPQTAFDPGPGVSATPTREAPRLYVLSNLGTVYAMRLHGSGG